MHVASSSPVVT